MIKYGIFIQGGESMKKIISLALATLLCAAVFVGCGSGENNTTSSKSNNLSSQNIVISNYLPHSERLTWNSEENSIPNYETDTSIGQIIFDAPKYVFDDNGKIKRITYKKSRIPSSYYDFIVKELNKLYGENEENGNKATWKVKIPTGEECLITLYNDIKEKQEVVLSYDIQRKTEVSSETSSGNTVSSTSDSTSTTSSTPKTPTITTSQKNALNRAKRYLKTMPFSYTGLIEQLEYEQYSHDDAVYAADNCGADWNEQAAKKAKSYLNTMAFSRKGLIEQLQYEGYTYEQAVYATDNCGADWNEQAAKKAQSYLDIMEFSRQGLIDQLQFEGYTYEQAVYGVNQVGL